VSSSFTEECILLFLLRLDDGGPLNAVITSHAVPGHSKTYTGDDKEKIDNRRIEKDDRMTGDFHDNDPVPNE
jgi:hypothetical protein